MRAQIDLCEIIWFCGINERKLHVSSFVWIADVVYNMWSEIYVEKAKRLFNFKQLKPFYTEIQAFRKHAGGAFKNLKIFVISILGV